MAFFSGAQGFVVSGGQFNIVNGDSPTFHTNPLRPSLQSHVSLNVLLPTDTFLLTSGSGQSSGKVEISTSIEVVGMVQVHIAVHYQHASAFEKTEISLIDRVIDDDRVERGVSILPSTTDVLYFDVMITLPSDGYIDRFATNVPNFSHHLNNLRHISFGELALSGSNGNINASILAAERMKLSTSNGVVSVEYWVGRTAVVHTSNAAISGAYVAAESLRLETTNGRIGVDITVDAKDNGTKDITMQTTNATLCSEITLNTFSGRGGRFQIEAKTSNGRLETHVASLPQQSVLALNATTSNAQASLTIPSEYQGNFELWSPNNVVHQSPNCGRTLERTVSRKKTCGKIYFDENGMPPGRLTLRTSSASATINF
ncbi:hypothetical protein C8R46DRAFT_1364218 [Mycena filopes]|nr:hypothetical protein C8R46DRAFT_1364218 [Mycena filopes]